VHAEDTLLGRQILIRLWPEFNVADQPNLDVTRPARLRRLQAGEISIHGSNCAWEAFVAPSGASLADIVANNRRLSWSETRPMLEQLSEELSVAHVEGSLPQALTLDQVWLQRDGRLQLVDFPVPRPGQPVIHAAGALDLLRDAATLALEGHVRLVGAPAESIQAPVPAHARAFLDRLLGKRQPFADVADCGEVLKQTRELPTHIDQPLRLLHLTVQALTLFLGLATMFLVSGMFAVIAVVERDDHVRSAEQILKALGEPGGRERLATVPGMTPLMADEERLRAALTKRAERDRAQAEHLRRSLNLVTRGLVPLANAGGELSPGMEAKTSARAMRDSGSTNQFLFEPFSDWRAASMLILFWPLAWALVAFTLRGGFSYRILGIGVVDARGRPVSRRRAALRALMVWLPIALLLCTSVWIQSNHPTLVNLHSLLWLGALLIMPLYVGLALAQPVHPPHDRLLGTYLVPR